MCPACVEPLPPSQQRFEPCAGGSPSALVGVVLAVCARAARRGLPVRLPLAPALFERRHEAGQVALFHPPEARLDGGRRTIEPAHLFGSVARFGGLIGIRALAAALGPALGRQADALAQPIRRFEEGPAQHPPTL